MNQAEMFDILQSLFDTGVLDAHASDGQFAAIAKTEARLALCFMQNSPTMGAAEAHTKDSKRKETRSQLAERLYNKR